MPKVSQSEVFATTDAVIMAKNSKIQCTWWGKTVSHTLSHFVLRVYTQRRMRSANSPNEHFPRHHPASNLEVSSLTASDTSATKRSNPIPRTCLPTNCWRISSRNLVFKISSGASSFNEVARSCRVRSVHIWFVRVKSGNTKTSLTLRVCSAASKRCKTVVITTLTIANNITSTTILANAAWPNWSQTVTSNWPFPLEAFAFLIAAKTDLCPVLVLITEASCLSLFWHSLRVFVRQLKSLESGGSCEGAGGQKQISHPTNKTKEGSKKSCSSCRR